MTASTLSRSQRAMQIERRTSRTWTVAAFGINVPSQRIAGVTYNTTLDSCTCGDAWWRGATCKHQLACRLMMSRKPAAQGKAS